MAWQLAITEISTQSINHKVLIGKITKCFFADRGVLRV